MNVRGKHGEFREDKTKPRNDYNKSFGIIMDWCESSFGQLYDHFNDISTIQQLLINLRWIFITHLHGDHHIGTLKMLSEREKAIKQWFSEEEIISKHDELKIYLIIPNILNDWIVRGIEHLEHKDLIEIIFLNELNPEPTKHFDIFRVADEGWITRKYIKWDPLPIEEWHKRIKAMEKNQTDKIKAFYYMLKKDMKIKRIYSVEAFHCYEAYGWMIESEDWKVFYSGDTKPNQNYINYGSNTTLLIHEATFDDTLRKEAAQKYHSTTSQALSVGKKMSAWRTWLTHFSFRYTKIPEITEDHFHNKAMCANDHMQLRLSDFEWAYKSLDIFRKMFSN